MVHKARNSPASTWGKSTPSDIKDYTIVHPPVLARFAGETGKGHVPRVQNDVADDAGFDALELLFHGITKNENSGLLYRNLTLKRSNIDL